MAVSDRLRLNRDITMSDPRIGQLIMVSPNGPEVLARYRNQLHPRLLAPQYGAGRASETAAMIDAVSADMNASITLLTYLLNIATDRELEYYRAPARMRSENGGEGAMAYGQEADLIEARKYALQAGSRAMGTSQANFMNTVADHLSHPNDDIGRDVMKHDTAAIAEHVRFLHEQIDPDPQEPRAQAAYDLCETLTERIMELAHEVDHLSARYHSLPAQPTRTVTSVKSGGRNVMIAEEPDTNVVRLSFGGR